MTADSRLLAHFCCQEIFFVDEIDRILTTPESIMLFPDDALQLGGGWLFMAGEPASGDWNMARMLGNSKIAVNYTGLLPTVETYLLVPEAETTVFTGQFKQLSSLLHFVSTIAINENSLNLPLEDSLRKDTALIKNDLATDETSAVDKVYIVNAELARELAGEGFSVNISYSQKAAGNFTNPDFAIYLLADEQVQGYVKTIRTTTNCVEVYIEIKPALRGRGLATKLLRLAIEQAHWQGRQLSYVVDELNHASIATAMSAGLTRSITLTRFLRKS